MTTRLCTGIGIAVLITIACAFALRWRPSLALKYDKAFWPNKSLESGSWIWALTPAGINYNLFIPEGIDRESSTKRIPLIIVFHGQGEKGIVKDRYGRLFTSAKSQQAFGERGAAVLAVQARVDYYSDPHAYSRLVQNLCIQYPCLDSKRIGGWGFSQGAAFVQELAMYDPRLFRAVASGSSYYAASPVELFRAARVRFYCATARNDAGIFEQGHRTGQILSLLCPDSRYVEYESRRHFYIEPDDKTGIGDERFIDWFAQALH